MAAFPMLDQIVFPIKSPLVAVAGRNRASVDIGTMNLAFMSVQTSFVAELTALAAGSLANIQFAVIV